MNLEAFHSVHASCRMRSGSQETNSRTRTHSTWSGQESRVRTESAQGWAEAWFQSVSEVAVSVHRNILNQNPGPGTWIQRTLCMDKPITIPRSRVNLILFNFSPQLCEGSSWVECVECVAFLVELGNWQFYSNLTFMHILQLHPAYVLKAFWSFHFYTRSSFSDTLNFLIFYLVDLKSISSLPLPNTA